MGYLIIVIFILQVIYLIRTGVLISQASAGSMNFHWGIAQRKNIDVLKFNNTIIDTDNMEQIKVNGNSMEKYGINDKDYIMVSIYNGEEIKRGDVIVHKISSCIPFNAPYKLRKYVCTVQGLNNQDWRSLYNNNTDLIDCDYSDFEEYIKQRINTLTEKKRDLNGTYVLSLTTNNGKTKCSLHSKDTIYGIAEYVI